MYDQVVEDMIGKVPESITGADRDSDLLEMKFSDGSSISFYHNQDCCESVDINDVYGELNDLIGHPILVAEERSEDGDESYESSTWTFYTFRSLGGTLEIRWLGTSNGYYSESVTWSFKNAK